MISQRLLYIASKSAYAALKVFGEQVLNESKQDWDTLSSDVQHRFMNAVKNCIDRKIENPTVVHGEWLLDMTKQGWIYGEEYSEQQKTHPCMRPYEELETGQQTKDQIYIAVLSPYYSI